MSFFHSTGLIVMLRTSRYSFLLGKQEMLYLSYKTNTLSPSGLPSWSMKEKLCPLKALRRITCPPLPTLSLCRNGLPDGQGGAIRGSAFPSISLETCLPREQLYSAQLWCPWAELLPNMWSWTQALGTWLDPLIDPSLSNFISNKADSFIFSVWF